MRNIFQYLALLLFLLCGSAWTNQVCAQESRFPASADNPRDEYQPLEDQPSLQPGGESEVTASRKMPPRSVKADSVANPKPATTVTKTPEKSEQDKPADTTSEDDLVSFNFLYYIIERYKMSDIVDK